MNEPRRPDPLRREPPTIDLPATAVSAKTEAAPSASDAASKGAVPSMAPSPGGVDSSLAAKPASETTAAAMSAPKPDPHIAEPSVAEAGISKAMPADAPKTETKTVEPEKPVTAGVGTGPNVLRAEASKAEAPKTPAPLVGVSPSGAVKPADAAPSKSPGLAGEPAVGAKEAKGLSPATSASASATGSAAAAAMGSAAIAAKSDFAKSDSAKSDSAASAVTSTGPKTASPTGPKANPTAEAKEILPVGATPITSRRSAAAPTEAARSTSGGFGKLLGAALLGGIVAAALGFAAFMVYPDGRPDPTLATRLDALERRVATAPTTTSPTTPSLEPRIAALEASVRQATEDARAARAAVEAASKQASEALARPAGGPQGDPAIRETVTALGTRIEDATKRTSENSAALAALGTQVAGLDTRIGAGAAALQASQSALQGLRTDVGSLRTSAGAMDTRAADTEKRLATVATDLGRLSGDLAKLSPAAVQAGLRVVVAGRLDDSLRAGAPLGPILSALDRLGVDQAALAPLKPFAEAAAPSAGALAAEFKPLAARMTVESRPSAETWTDRLLRLFGKVVTVRAVGDGSGTDLPGLVARIETALARGVLADAAMLWDQLPETAKRLSADWAGRLKARAAAEAAARRIVGTSIAALDTATVR